MSTVATRRERGERSRVHARSARCARSFASSSPTSPISKIRYLEDQGLISPRRTRGGYRLFAPDDIERLATILRLQRDEFLPLRVIREELDGPGATADRARRRTVGVLGQEDEIDEAELCERAAVSPEFVRQLEEFGLLVSRVEGGERLYGESEADIAAACARLARFGIDARHLGPSSPEPVGSRRSRAARRPGLRSRNAERRKTALEDLEGSSRVAQELSHLLFVRDLRATVERTS